MNRWWIIVVLATLLAACGHTTKGGAIGVDRSQLLLVPEAAINQSSYQAYDQLINKARTSRKLDTNKRLLRRVQTITKRLVQQVGVFRQDARRWPWEVHVIDDNQLNAWCMPGGKIGIYTGIINRLKLNDEEIAAIIGHEIAHALREHGRERASQQMASNLGLSLLGSLAGLNQGSQRLASLVTDVTFKLPNSRKHETEADLMGVELAARAGYDPRAAVSVWQKMARMSKGQPPQWLSTHPNHSTRIDELRRSSSRVMPLYQKARRR